MKQLIISIATLLTFSAGSEIASAQIINPGRTVKDKGVRRANDRIDNTIDKGFDKIDEGIGNVFKGKKKKAAENSEESSEQEYNSNGKDNSGNSSSSSSSSSNKKNSSSSNSNFDFVPGTQIIYSTNFANEAVGDFPIDFNTNASGQVVTVSGKSGKWLSLDKNGAFIPDNITNLPDNFTLEFDLGIINDPTNNKMGFGVNFTTEKDELMKNVLFSYGTSYLCLHPSAHVASFGIIPSSEATMIENEIEMNQWNVTNRTFAKISIWRQKGRLRVYVNQDKVVDVPRFFVENKPYDLAFFRHFFDDCQILMTNIRFAVAGADLRTKFMSEGRFATNEILFAVNSDVIKPESNKIINEVAALLKENGSIRMRIVGHTDSDGDGNANLSLSKRRAESVKNKLVSEHGIAASRLSTDGKGASQPVESNSTAAGKAKNRRVEFVKI